MFANSISVFNYTLITMQLACHTLTLNFLKI